jgi:hypothetical protein
VDNGTGEVISLRLPAGYGINDADVVFDDRMAPVGESGFRVVSGCPDPIQGAFLITKEDVVDMSAP